VTKASKRSPAQPRTSASSIKFEKVPRAKLPTKAGEFLIYGFRDSVSGEAAVARVAGRPSPEKPTLVRIHSQCLTGDVFSSNRCDCGEQLDAALRLIARTDAGVLVYQQKEGRGIGRINKIHAYELQDQGLDTVAANIELGFDADLRDYRMPAEILKYLGATRVHLLSNNPEKVQGLMSEGILVEKRIPLEITPNSTTQGYLKAKKEKLGHILHKL